MSVLVLKIIAYATMLVDHTAHVLYSTRLLRYGDLYLALRGIGRIAFPLFCFMIVEGERHTKDRPRYLFRLLLFGLVSEVPFDLALFMKAADWDHQNVYFTLLLGLMCVWALDWGSHLKTPLKRAAGWAAGLLLSAVLAYTARRFLRTDYGAAGVACIVVMGLMNTSLGDWLRARVYDPWAFRALFVLPAVMVLVLMTNALEWMAFLAVFFMLAYNGKKGYTSPLLKWGGYVFYPGHLLLLAFLFVVPYLKGV